MTIIKQFPQIKNDLEKCAGCHKRIEGEHWEIQLPGKEGLKNIALCDECYKDVEEVGVF